MGLEWEEKWRLNEGQYGNRKEIGDMVRESEGVVGQLVPTQKGWMLR